MDTIIMLFLMGCIPVYVFLYNLIAAISLNIRQAVRTDEPYQVVAVRNIMAASAALTLILCVMFMFCM